MRLHRISTLPVTALLLAMLVLAGCGAREHELLAPGAGAEGTAAQVPQDVIDQISKLHRIASTPDRGVALLSGDAIAASPPVVVPAGSVDALAAAIAAAGPNGSVVLQTGLHTENATVTITHRVSILGETGAVLRSAVTPSNELPTVVRPALHVLGAEGVTIWNVAFAPTGAIGGTAILLENARRSTVGWNSMSGFQYGVLLQNAHESTVVGNTIAVSTAWLNGDLSDCEGIININGSGVRIANNDVSGGILNIFCSGTRGFVLANSVREAFVGIILCKIPEGSFLLPGGAVVGAEQSAADWHLEGNSGTANFYAGLLVIDGASNNRLVNNGGSGNGAYDIEMLGTTCLFGFQTPTSVRNTLVVGSHANLAINDFGVDNRIIGRATVTHNVSAPCAEGAGTTQQVLR